MMIFKPTHIIPVGAIYVDGCGLQQVVDKPMKIKIDLCNVNDVFDDQVPAKAMSVGGVIYWLLVSKYKIKEI